MIYVALYFKIASCPLSTFRLEEMLNLDLTYASYFDYENFNSLRRIKGSRQRLRLKKSSPWSIFPHVGVGCFAVVTSCTISFQVSFSLSYIYSNYLIVQNCTRHLHYKWIYGDFGSNKECVRSINIFNRLSFYMYAYKIESDAFICMQWSESESALFTLLHSRCQQLATLPN